MVYIIILEHLECLILNAVKSSEQFLHDEIESICYIFTMASFDIISEVNKHELQNAVDQTQRELENRFDFKGVKVEVKLSEKEIMLMAPSDFQLSQVREILKTKLSKRQVDILYFEFKDPTIGLQESRQRVEIKQGIDSEASKKIKKQIQDKKFKVQISIEGNKLRLTGKSKDELQSVIQFLRLQSLGLPLQFDNFRD